MALKKSQLYSSIWSACDELRGGMDASQYKDYVLVLLFVRYVSDKYANKPNSLVIIPEGGSFKDLVALKGKINIGEGINTVLDVLAEANGLNGVINTVDFDDEEKLGKGKEMQDKLSKLIAIFENPDLDFSKNKADGDDLLGDAYEYLMKHFAVESGKSKGQFYTPAEVSRIIAKVIGASEARDRTQSVYDPTCGSGSLLLKVASEAKPVDITIYGQEKENTTAALAILNMWLHGEPEATIKKGQSTLSDPLFKDGNKLKTFDYVVANPPFSYKSWRNGFTPENDDYERFEGFGIPPAKNGDYAFLLHIIKSMKSTGKGAVILPHGVLFRGNTEANIRTNLIKRGYIEGIIGLPANLFYGTGIPACIIVLDKAYAQDRKGIFMIDASKGFVKDGNKNRLREQDLKRITDTWESKEEIEKYSHFATLEELEMNEFNLNIPRYIDSSEEEDIQDIEAHLKGGIPKHDIDLLENYWEILKNLRTQLFSNGARPEYFKVNHPSDEVTSVVQNHQEFKEFKKSIKEKIESWKQDVSDYLNNLDTTTPPKSVVEKLSSTLLEKFNNQQLIDKYGIYQHLMIYWEETLQDDVYVITADDWKAGNEVVRLNKENKKGKRTEIAGLGGLEGRLIPVSLMISTYFSEEQKQLDSLNSELDLISQEMNEITEENDGDEGLLSDVVNEKGNITKGDLKNRLRDTEGDPESKDEYELLKKYSDLSDKQTDLKKQIKELENKIEKKVISKYPELSIGEIKDVVINKKWMKTLEKRILNEVTKLSQTLTRRIKELSDRYEETWAEVTLQTDSLETEINEFFEMILSSRDTLESKNSWRKYLLADIATFYKGKGLGKKDISSNGQYKCIHYGELFTNYGFYIDKVKSRTNLHAEMFLSKANDVLMPTSDVTPYGLAKASCIQFDNVVLGGDVLIIRPHKDFSGEFLSLIIRFDKSQILQLVSGTTVYHLYASDMKKFEFYAPSLENQLDIVKAVKKVTSQVSNYERKLLKIERIKQGAMQQLLTGKIRLLNK